MNNPFPPKSSWKDQAFKRKALAIYRALMRDFFDKLITCGMDASDCKCSMCLSEVAAAITSAAMGSVAGLVIIQCEAWLCEQYDDDTIEGDDRMLLHAHAITFAEEWLGKSRAELLRQEERCRRQANNEEDSSHECN